MSSKPYSFVRLCVGVFIVGILFYTQALRFLKNEIHSWNFNRAVNDTNDDIQMGYDYMEDNTELRRAPDICDPSTRRQHIQTECTKRGWTTEHQYGIVDDKHRLLYCSVPKAGSISFRTFLGSLVSNFTDVNNVPLYYEETGFRQWHKLSTSELDDVGDYKKLIVVRHPMDRLRSAYNAKLTHPGELNNKALDERNVEIIDQYFEDNGIPRNQSFDPWTELLTFPQFLDLVGRHYDDGFVDEHWLPMVQRCGPCEIDYDFILRLETLASDTPPLYDYINERQDGDIAVTHENKKENLGKSFWTKFDKIDSYFEDIDPIIMERVKKVYEKDLVLFGYGWDKDKGSDCLITCDTGEQCC